MERILSSVLMDGPGPKTPENMLAIARTPESNVDPLDPSVARAQAGELDAQQSLVAGLLPRVRNLVRYLVRGDRDVDDIAQEALVAVVRGLPGYRGEGRLESWADRVAARAAFAWLRKRRGDPLHHGAPALAVPDRAVATDHETRRRLALALDDVPEAQRNALVLHHVLGMSVPEIASEVGAPEKTVRSRLRLGRLRLRQTLAAAGAEVP